MDQEGGNLGVVVIVTFVVMIMAVRFVGFRTRLGQKLCHFTITALHVDRFSIILQSSRSCTVGEVDNSCRFFRSQNSRLQSEMRGAAALVGGCAAMTRKTHR